MGTQVQKLILEFTASGNWTETLTVNTVHVVQALKSALAAHNDDVRESDDWLVSRGSGKEGQD